MDGFFPIGVNGQWHGGIHFDAGTATRFNQHDGVRCIADGEIIAWRLNDEPMRSLYTQGTGRYSNGFVLVRHRLQYPDTQISGVFYSLYMHLATTKFYEDPDVDGIPYIINPLVCPNWWGKDPLKRIAAGKDERPDWSIPDSVKDKKERDAMRKEKGILFTKKGTKDPAAWLPNGQKLTLKPGTGDKRELGTVADKTLLYLHPAKLADSKTAPLTTAAPGVPPGLEIEEAKLTKVPARPQPTDKVNIVEPIPVEAGEIIGHLGYYERFADWDRAILHLETFAGPEFRGFIDQCRAQDARAPANTKRILIIEKDAKPVTGASDSTITIPAGEWIKLTTGTPAGSPWIKVQRGINGNAAKDAEAKAKAAKANKPEPKPLKVVFKPSGTTAWIKRGALSNNLKNPTELKAELVAWENFPLQKNGPPGPPVFAQLVVNTKQKSSAATDYTKDDQGARWWKVRYPTVDAKGQASNVEGWVSDASFPKVSLCTRWAWPGFELIVEPTPKPVKNLETRQCNNYGATSPVLATLLAVIDLNKDGKVTKEEIWDAWQNPYLATYRLSRLIIEQDSEWGMPMAIWNEFGQALMRDADRFTKAIWEEDKKRIEKLLFWNEVKGQNGLPSGPRVWHMHPIGLIGNFAKSGCECSEEWRYDYEFLEESEGKLKPNGYVPKDKEGNALGQSGVTISTGVDLGQQTRAGTKTILDNYIEESGNPDNVDVDALLDLLNPYFSPLRKQAAIDKLKTSPLTVTDAQNRLLAGAFKNDNRNKISKMFDRKNTLKMKFKKLPEEAQTVILDFAYQYGDSDSLGNIRQTFWGYVYRAQWKRLADWLLGNPDPYQDRRRREGERIQQGIDTEKLPESGGSCTCEK